jgi:hypothetical protein
MFMQTEVTKTYLTPEFKNRVSTLVTNLNHSYREIMDICETLSAYELKPERSIDSDYSFEICENCDHT